MSRRPSPDPKRPADNRPPTKPRQPKPTQPKPPPRQPKTNLTVLRRGEGYVDYRDERGAIAATAPALSPAGLATIRRLLPPVRQEVAA